jgi:hypothetical protein
MATSKPPSSPNSLTSRKPFEPISHTWEIPGALYEIRQLAYDDDCDRIRPLIESIIQVSQADPTAWQQIKNALPHVAAAVA